MSNSRIELLLEWIKQDSSDPFLTYALALEYKKANNKSECLALLQKLRSLFPNYLPAYYQLAQILEESGNKTAALQVYNEGLHLSKEQKEIKTTGEINEAIQRLESE